MREPVQDTLAAGFIDALERCRVGQRVGGRHRLGQQADDELATVGIVFAKVAGGYPLIHFPAPGQVSPHVTTIQRITLPGRLVEALVPGRRLDLRAVEQDILQLDAESGHMLGAVHGLLQHLPQDHAHAAQQVAPARGKCRIQAQRVHGGLLGEFFIVLVHGDTPRLTQCPWVARGLNRFVQVLNQACAEPLRSAVVASING
ncbi:hypothetical protein D9M71_179800 [compost metagenome]